MSVLIVHITDSSRFAESMGWWFLPGTNDPCPTAISECARGVWYKLPHPAGKPPYSCVIPIREINGNRIALACYAVKDWLNPPLQAHFPRRWLPGTYIVDGIERIQIQCESSVPDPEGAHRHKISRDPDIDKRWEFIEDISHASHVRCGKCQDVIGKKFTGNLNGNGCAYIDQDILPDGLFVQG